MAHSRQLSGQEDLMELRGPLVALARRTFGVVGVLRPRALTNSGVATRDLRTAIADRTAVAPSDAGAPGALTRLDRAECLRLLRTQCVGRLAYLARDGVPDIVPVNYVISGDTLLFRSAPGPKLQAAQRADIVAIAVDDLDQVHRTGWSVVLTGRARRLTDSDQRQFSLLPEPWAAGPRRHLVRVTPGRIDGRRLT